MAGFCETGPPERSRSSSVTALAPFDLVARMRKWYVLYASRLSVTSCVVPRVVSATEPPYWRVSPYSTTPVVDSVVVHETLTWLEPTWVWTFSMMGGVPVGGGGGGGGGFSLPSSGAIGEELSKR